jgi:murein DD-endopeptidase MepM/ murein hydrolase activator NlpD
MPVSIGEVQARIGHIRAMLAAPERLGVPAAGVPAAGVPAAGVPAAGGVAAGPGSTPAVTGAEFAASLDAAVAAGQSTTPAAGWALPTSGEVTSGFGPRWGTRHEGIDIAAGTGAPIRAATDGVVRKASWYGGYGNAVIIEHGGGVRTLYGHASQLLVRPGERVTAGQVIARVGSTGDSTGPHLHFEVEVGGKRVDPRPWLRERGITI